MKSKRISIKEIQQIVSSYFFIDVEDMIGPSQIHHLAYARKIAMYFCRQILNFSYPGIGIYFGGRAHTTVMHAVKDIGDKVESDDGDYRNDVMQITNMIYEKKIPKTV